MQEGQEKVVGLIGTIAFHVLLVVFLLFAYLEAPSRNDMSELGGVPVMFGNVPDAFGKDEPFGGGGKIEDKFIAPTGEDVSWPEEAGGETPPDTQGSDEGDEPIATQDLDETIAINEAENKAREAEKAKELEKQKLLAEKQKAEAAKKAKADADAKAKKDKAIADAKAAKDKAVADAKAQAAAKAKAEADAKSKKIKDQMSGLFGNGSGSGSRGETEGTGTQGVLTGNASFGKTSGVGGWGSFDLGGRSVGSGGLIRPNYSVNDYGTVVVDIVVNPQGAVVEASIGRGTNTPSAELKREALNAARRTRFNSVTKAGNQKGTITYKFNLN